MKEPTVQELKDLCSRVGLNTNRLPDLVDIDEWSPGGDGRLDMLTLDLKTWLIRGFEIKISRADFLQDRKWESYLPYVNYFWFVVPGEGIIKPEELPPDIGLQVYGEWPSRAYCHEKTGTTWGLKEVKKARKLQPELVRLSYGELKMTQILIRLCRSRQWRDQDQKSKFRTQVNNRVYDFLRPLEFPGKELVCGRILDIIQQVE